jgi:hypothetical protein
MTKRQKLVLKIKHQKKKIKSKTDIKSKKGGNFLGSVGELVAPTGWGGFASAASLLEIDRAGTALRRFSKKMSGGMSYTEFRGYKIGKNGQWTNQNGSIAFFPLDKKDQTFFVEVAMKYLEEHPETKLPLSKEVIDNLDRAAYFLKKKTQQSEKDSKRMEAEERLERSVAESKRLEENFALASHASEEAKFEADRLAAETKEAFKRAEQLVLAAKKAEDLFKKSIDDVIIYERMLKRLNSFIVIV